jgi:hypothetical protein
MNIGKYTLERIKEECRKAREKHFWRIDDAQLCAEYCTMFKTITECEDLFCEIRPAEWDLSREEQND